MFFLKKNLEIINLPQIKKLLSCFEFYHSHFWHDQFQIDENIFATATNAALEETPGADNFMQMRPRLNVNNRTENVLGKVEAGQSKWMNNVEEQRRKVMMDHTMLN